MNARNSTARPICRRAVLALDDEPVAAPDTPAPAETTAAPPKPAAASTPAATPAPAPQANGHAGSEHRNGVNGNGHNGANGHKATGGAGNGVGHARCLRITFRRSGDIDRDMFRLREIYESVRDPRGRDRFVINIESKGKPLTLAFPEDPCTINDRLTGELVKHFRVDVAVDE